MKEAENRGFFCELLRVVFPIAMLSLLSSLVSASDALMLGLLDQASLSAISLATQVQFVLGLFQAAFMIGASVLAAQYWGLRDRDTIEQVLGLSLRLSVPVSSLFTAAALFAPVLLMRLFTSDPELISRGIPYLRIVSASYLLTGISQMYLNIMKNSGRVARSSLYASAAVVLNIALNLLLIFGLAGLPAMGIRGAALATVIARAVELALCLLENRKPEVVRMRLRHCLKTAPELRKRFYHYMAPVLANEIAWGGGVTMFSVIMGHLGSDAVAANSITNILKNILTCFSTGLGAGSGIMLGNLLGAGELDAAKACSRKLIRASLLLGACAGAVLLAALPPVLRFSGSLTETARAYVKYMGFISAYYVVGRSLNGVLIEGTFCAGGDTRFGFLCDLVNMWCFIIPLASLAAFVLKWPVMAVYFILNLDEICKIPFEIRHYRKYKWLKNLTEQTKGETV